MTVNNVSFKIIYIGDGVTKTFPFSFPTDGREASIVVFYQFASGAVRTLIPNVEYFVTLNDPIAPNPTEVGGFITTPAGAPALPIGDSIAIARLLPAEQTNSIANQSIIYPPVLERRLDYLTMVDQELAGFFNSCFHVPLTDPPPAPLPSAVLRANQQAVFDANGNMVPGGAVIGTIISGPMIPVVTAPTLDAARQAMGVPPIVSPAFTGNPTAPTAAVGDNDTTIATTAFVQAQLSSIGAQFPSGTRMIFQQVTPPVGWVTDVTHNDKALRVVSASPGAGGIVPFSTVFNRVTTDAYTLGILDIPTHAHGVNDPTHTHGGNLGGVWPNTTGGAIQVDGGTGPSVPIWGGNNFSGTTADATGISIGNAGGGQPHAHGNEMRVQYVDVIIAVKS